MEQILGREMLKPLRYDNTLVASFDALNSALVKTHEGIHEEAKKLYLITSKNASKRSEGQRLG